MTKLSVSGPPALPLAPRGRPAPHRRSWSALTLLGVIVTSLAACGGGGGDDASGGGQPPVAVEKPSTQAEARRFLAQASFGADDASVARVMDIGYAAWIDEQLALPATSHRLRWEQADAELKAQDPNDSAGGNETLNAFWQIAATAPDQLRQRVAYALSQIFVVSLQDSGVGNEPRAVAAYMDTLATGATGSYRPLLEQVSLHPMMGRYLSHLRNQKADARTGRVPDENYAREVMQLFSIGLLELNADGSVRTTGNGVPMETYGPADIAGLAKVFTGWSWTCPAWPADACFYGGSSNGSSDPDHEWKPMVGYPKFHATEEKSFLGTTIPAQTTADPTASLRVALDRLADHPNVGPFIGKQLIQRLVTSNPSPAYVAAVSAAWANNGAGARGDLKAVVKAILMHPEARRSGQTSDRDGRLNEPLLRLTAYLRAFPHTSGTGAWRINNTDNPASQLGMSPLRSPSVFNFYRPGYVAPGSASAQAGLVAPELQITHETSVAGYINFMRDALSSGLGSFTGGTPNRRDLQRDWAPELALADQPAALVAHVAGKLLTAPAPAALATEIEGAVTSITIPALNASGSNQSSIDSAKRNRVLAAVLLVLASPEYAVIR